MDRFTQRVELDEVHSAASFLRDWDWLVVGDELAELGYLRKTTAAVPATSTCVTRPKAAEDIVPFWEGGWGREITQEGSTVAADGGCKSSSASVGSTSERSRPSASCLLWTTAWPLTSVERAYGP